VHPVPTPQGESSRPDENATSILVAEYEYVAGLIPFYRRLELTAMAGTGLLLSAIIAALAALEAAESPNKTAEALILAGGAWVPVFLLLIEIMALTRLRRASLYVKDTLQPLALELTGNEGILGFERSPTNLLVVETSERRERYLAKNRKEQGSLSEAGLDKRVGRRTTLRLFGWTEKVFASDRLVRLFASSAPLICAMVVTSFVLAATGSIVQPSGLTLTVGPLGALAALVLGAYGVAFTQLHEGR
jgi:hypothetical protein